MLGLSLYEEDKEGPIEFRFEGAKADVEAQGGELDQAMALVGSFLKSAPSQTAERAAILASLKTQQIKERTGERALTELKKLGRVKKAGHGVWQKEIYGQRVILTTGARHFSTPRPLISAKYEKLTSFKCLLNKVKSKRMDTLSGVAGNMTLGTGFSLQIVTFVSSKVPSKCL